MINDSVGQEFLQDKLPEETNLYSRVDFLEPSAGDEKSDTQIFYAPPMRPRLTAKELNQVLGAAPFVVQIRGEKK